MATSGIKRRATFLFAPKVMACCPCRVGRVITNGRATFRLSELPYSENPPQGYIATANNAVVGSDYKYLITHEWDKGYRARRIVNMIDADKKAGKITLAAIQKQQGDNANLSAQEVLPFVANLTFTDPRLKAPQQYLLAWEKSGFQQNMESGEAAFYNMFWSKLIINTFYDELPDTVWA